MDKFGLEWNLILEAKLEGSLIYERHSLDLEEGFPGVENAQLCLSNLTLSFINDLFYLLFFIFV